MPKFIQDHHDIFQVILAHLGAITISFLNVENTLKITSLLLAIGYTSWKWVTEYINKKQNENSSSKGHVHRK
jgi:hypothetical protein